MKSFFVIVVISTMYFVNVKGQVQYPTNDLYDSNMMNMYLDALSNTSEKRENLFCIYLKIAYDYFNKKDYQNFLVYSDKALGTYYYTAELYFMRGYAYEMLRNYKQSRKEYKLAYKHGYTLAKERLDLIKHK